MTDRISARELGRATLARQLLLDRSDLAPLDAIRRMAGLNGQDALEPYLMLWTRLAGFTPPDLTRLLEDRSVVRASMMRNTQHIVAADDYLAWRPALQPALDRSRRGFFGRDTKGVDLDELAAAGRELLRDGMLPRPELGRRLGERWPEHDRTSLARSVQALLPVVHPPPSLTWDKRGGATPFVLAPDWIGRPLATGTDPDAMLLRYLEAFGPAGVKDMQAWSGLTRLREVAERMAPALRTFTGPEGVELYDLPDAPRPDPGTPAPVRLLPLVDNLLVAHADRTRVLADEHRGRVCVGAVVEATVLVDGVVAGIWRFVRERGLATRVQVERFVPFCAATRDGVAREALSVLGFVDGPDDAHDVEFILAA